MARPVVLLFEPIHEAAVARLRERAEVRLASSLEEGHLIPMVVDVEGIIVRASGRMSRRLEHLVAVPHPPRSPGP